MGQYLGGLEGPCHTYPLSQGEVGGSQLPLGPIAQVWVQVWTSVGVKIQCFKFTCDSNTKVVI
jgi:hypothetical protein